LFARSSHLFRSNYSDEEEEEQEQEEEEEEKKEKDEQKGRGQGMSIDEETRLTGLSLPLSSHSARQRGA